MTFITFEQLPAAVTQLRDDIALIKQLLIDQANTPNLNTSASNNARPITQKELCEFLNVTEPTILRWRKKGKIPFLKIGTAIRFNLSDVLKSLGKS